MVDEDTALGSKIDFRKSWVRAWRGYHNNLGVLSAGAGLVVVGSVLSFGVLAGPLMAGLVSMSQRALRAETLALQDLRDGFSRWMPASFLGLLLVLLWSTGTAFFVLPGAILMVVLAWAPWFFTLHRQGIGFALRESLFLVRRVPAHTVLGVTLAAGANLLGAATLIGWLVSLPLSTLFLTQCFEYLTREQQDDS